MAKKKSNSPWDPETEEMIRKSLMMTDLNLDADNMRIERPLGNLDKMSKTAMKGKDASKAARAKALKDMMTRKKEYRIPASPTR